MKCPRQQCNGTMREGKAIGHNPGSTKYRPLQTIRGIRDVELVDVLKCDVCGHSIGWHEVLTLARRGASELLDKVLHLPQTTIHDLDVAAQMLSEARKNNSDDKYMAEAYLSIGEKIMQRISRRYWPARTPYQIVEARQ